MGFVSLTTSSNPCALFPAIPQDNSAFMFTYGNSRRKPVSTTLCHFVYSMLSTRSKLIHPSWQTTERPTAFPASTCSAWVWNCLHGTKICHATLVNNVPKSNTKDEPQQLPSISQMATSNPGLTKGIENCPQLQTPQKLPVLKNRKTLHRIGDLKESPFLPFFPEQQL